MSVLVREDEVHPLLACALLGDAQAGRMPECPESHQKS